MPACSHVSHVFLVLALPALGHSALCHLGPSRWLPRVLSREPSPFVVDLLSRLLKQDLFRSPRPRRTQHAQLRMLGNARGASPSECRPPPSGSRSTTFLAWTSPCRALGLRPSLRAVRAGVMPGTKWLDKTRPPWIKQGPSQWHLPRPQGPGKAPLDKS